MPNTTKLSESERAMLEKYLRGDIPPATADTNAFLQRTQGTYAPLSFGQQQVWLLSQFVPSTPIYNECVTISLPASLDVAILEQSLNEFIRRHEAWRSSFPTINGLPVQVINPPPKISLPVVDLRYLKGPKREAEALRRATEVACIPFDLAQHPLLRVLLIRLGDDEYRLFLTLHQIIFDGHALYQVFLPELQAIYQSSLSGQPSSAFLGLPIQCADYASWQRELLQGDMLADQLAYWKKQLAGAPAGLELPADHFPPPVRTYRGSMRSFALSKRMTDDLKALSHQEGVTFYTTLVAAFNALLYRYTGQEDIVIGTNTADRKRSEARKLMGFFSNTLVLRTNLSGNPPFLDLMSRAGEVITSAEAHGDMPFEYLVRELQPERNLNQNPLFQVLLTFEPAPPMLPSGWTMSRMDVSVGTSKFDLSLELEERREGLVGFFEYNTDLFDEVTIDRMLGHWRTLLEGIVADPTKRLSELQLLTNTERQQLLVARNATQSAYARERCVHQLFEDQVRHTPDAVAVLYRDKQLTYRQLNALANRLAHHLRQLEVGPEVLVGLCMERSLEMVVGLLGILKAGGAYVPLDPTYPAERIAFMLEDAQAPVLVTQQALVSTLLSYKATVVCLDTDAEVLARQNAADPAPVGTTENLAYVIYTSGSTGRPKGVQVLHRALVNLLTSMRQQPGLAAGDTLLAVTTLSFDIAALELFLPLIVGARVIVADRDVVANGTALAEMLAYSRATVMQATPITWRILLAAGWLGNQHLKVLCGGEALPLELAQQLLPKVDSLWNVYGPTETTIWSTVCRIGPTDETISIGRPIANTQVYLLDAHLQLVPDGVPGELYIGGDGLARGYLNRPELTTERFIPHPFSNEPGARLYRTGDLARYRVDGTIELIGRLDHQVKLRGFRIELGEIEEVLIQHPAVRQAVVIAREDPPGDKRLVAYIILHEEQTIRLSELQNYLGRHLPAYMVPYAFVMLEAFPQTPNGKVDRRALPEPEPTVHTAEENFAAPSLIIHHQLLAIWEELLDVRPIGIRDNFFDLGGNSFLAVRMVNQFEQMSGKRVPLSTLFAGPTIEQLSDALIREEQTRPLAPLVAVQANGSRRPLFFLHGDWTGGAFYCFKLARYLGSDQPFYVLEPYQFEDLLNLPTFEAMAAAHLESLRAIQPEGPYLLAGWCNGGLVAYEMARQLHAQQQEVALLLLMDPEPPLAFRSVARAILSRIGEMLGMDQAGQLDWYLRLRHVYRWLRFTNYRKRQVPSSLENSESVERKDGRDQVNARWRGLTSIVPEPETLRQDWVGAYDWIASVYVPRPYLNKVTIFWASEEPRRKAAWRKMPQAAQLEVYTVPGTHSTCITENLHILAEHLRMCLEKSQTTETAP